MTSRILTVTFLVIATMMIGIGIIAPLMPIYAEQLGANGMWLGIIFAAFATTRMIFTPLFGRISDRARRGRKWFLLCGLIAFSILSLGYLAANTVYQLTLMRMLHGLSSALVVPIAFAYIGDITPKNEEGKYMSFINLATFIGMGIGPFLGGKLADAYGIHAAFWALFMLGNVCCLLVLFLMPDLKRERAAQASLQRSVRQMVADDLVKGLLIIRACSAVRRAIIMAFLPVFASYIGLAKTHMGAMISVFVITAAVVQYPAGLLADRFNRARIIIIGELVALFCFAFFPAVHSFPQLLVVGIAAGLAGGFAMPSVLAMNADIGRRYGMASMMGLMDAAMGFGMLFGALTSGFVMDALGLPAVFYYGIAAGLVGVSCFTLFSRRARRVLAEERLLQPTAAATENPEV